MVRTRISTTVSDERLRAARRLQEWRNDAEMLDAALQALLELRRAAEVDAAYATAYAAAPLEDADAWGDLASFRAAAAST